MGILAVIVFIAIVALLFWLLPSKGKAGEMRVASLLKRLPEDKYHVFNNVLLSSNGYSTQIDHIVVSIYGIFVIETKFYKGMIYGGENSEYWTQNIWGNKYRLRNPIHQNMGHIRALKFLLKDFGEIPYISIVAFSRQADLGVKAHTPVIYWNQILRVISQFVTPVLSAQQVQGICRTLRTINQSEDKEANRQHISNVRQNEIRRDAAVSSGHCPKCGGVLVLRHGKYGNFYGCSNYPKCKFTTPS